MPKIKEHAFLKDWRKQQTDILLNIFPSLSKDDIHDFLQDIVDERLVDKDAKLHNNQQSKSLKISLLQTVDWFERVKPIAGGFGVFFKNHHQALNPNGVMLDKFMKLRKSIKGNLKKYKEGTYEYMLTDLRQNNEKVNANSFYGAGGAPTSNFYNVYTATSVTATGQSLISTTEQAFESFLSNSVHFIDMDDCMHYLENIRREEKKMDGRFLPNVSVEKLMERLKEMFHQFKPEYETILLMYLMNQSQDLINRMYFKNNIYEFSYLRKIRMKLHYIAKNVEEFKDPNEVPKNVESDMDDLWDYYKEFVFYNYPAFNRIQRLKTEKRKVVVVVDTDSNMLNLNPWVMFMHKYIISTDNKLLSRDADQMRYISVNIMCFLLSKMVADVLWKYTKKANIPKEERYRINMKNEYMFTRLILTNKKKRYISSIRLREGKEILPEKQDVKGHDFMKSSAREETKQYFLGIVKNRLLNNGEIVISEILRDLEKFEGMILESLRKGEKSFIIPKSVKELGAYKEPYREQGVRAILAWNYLYPNRSIELPEKIDIVKTTLTNEEELEKLKKIDPDKYEIIKKHIFNNPEKKISSKGMSVIALPKNIDAIPEWLMPFIDYETIITDNLSKFNSVLEALGIETMKVGKKVYFTNILKI